MSLKILQIPSSKRNFQAGQFIAFACENKINSGIYQLKNKHNQDIGIACYNAEIPDKLLFLSNETLSIKEIFAKRLQRALEIRQKELKTETTFRVLNGIHDGLSGIYLDKVENHLFLTIDSSGFETEIHTLTNVIQEFFNPEAIHLRNFTKYRNQHNLRQSSQLIEGQIIAPAITIFENLCEYEHSIESQEKFPIEYRDLRKDLYNDFKNQKTSFLAFTGKLQTSFFVPSDLLNQIEFVHIDTKKQFSEICQDLRDLFEQNKRFDGFLFFWNKKWNPKNQKAFFHIWYNLLKTLTPMSSGYLITKAETQILKTLHQAQTKLGGNYHLLKQYSLPADFQNKASHKAFTSKLITKLIINS